MGRIWKLTASKCFGLLCVVIFGVVFGAMAVAWHTELSKLSGESYHMLLIELFPVYFLPCIAVVCWPLIVVPSWKRGRLPAKIISITVIWAVAAYVLYTYLLSPLVVIPC